MNKTRNMDYSFVASRAFSHGQINELGRPNNDWQQV